MSADDPEVYADDLVDGEVEERTFEYDTGNGAQIRVSADNLEQAMIKLREWTGRQVDRAHITDLGLQPWPTYRANDT